MINVKKLLNRAMAWLVGSSRKQLPVDSCQLSALTTDNCQPTTAQAPLCPICEGRPLRGNVEQDALGPLVQWFYAPCRCGCGAVRRSRCCPVCCGAGRVTRELIVEYEALGEVSLRDYRRAAVGN